MVEEWPDLGDPCVSTKTDKPFNNIKISRKKMKSISKEVEKEDKKIAWKDENSINSNSTSLNIKETTTSFSLLDVMNEEMQKLELTKKRQQQQAIPPRVTKSKTKWKNAFTPEKKETSPVKGWSNLPTIQNSQSASSLNTSTQSSFPSLSTTPPTIHSFSQIIELEKRSSEQYNKLKNRPLHIIQLEEKAVEEFKMVYELENWCSNINIKIELIDEEDFTHCIPLWQKKH
jgi:hypothetical protein